MPKGRLLSYQQKNEKLFKSLRKKGFYVNAILHGNAIEYMIVSCREPKRQLTLPDRQDNCETK